MARFCAETKSLQSEMKTELNKKVLWRDTAFPSLHISPLIGELLSARSQLDETDTPELIFEAFRLAALLYIGALRGMFGLDALSADAVYIDKLQTLLQWTIVDLAFPPILLIWILAVSYTAQRISHEKKTWFAAVLSNTLQSNSVSSLETLLGLLAEVVWDSQLFDVQSQSLNELLAMRDP
jgi:hypothetical protein